MTTADYILLDACREHLADLVDEMSPKTKTGEMWVAKGAVSKCAKCDRMARYLITLPKNWQKNSEGDKQ